MNGNEKFLDDDGSKINWGTDFKSAPAGITLSDEKIPVDVNNDFIADYYKADIVSAQDYYPFGMMQPGRHFSTSKYTYSFNGKLRDDNVYGKGNFYNYGFRMYDSRLGRFLSVDPLAKKYAGWSPYAFAQDRVIDGIDLEGLEHYKVRGTDMGDGTTLIQVYLAKNGYKQPFQVDYNDKTVSTTQGDWGYKQLQERYGKMAKTGDRRLGVPSKNGSVRIVSGYAVNDQWSSHFFMKGSLTRNKYVNATRQVSSSQNLGGLSSDFGNNKTGTISKNFNVGSSSTAAKVTVNFQNGGSIDNTFNVIGANGKTISTFNGNGSKTFNVPANSNFKIQVAGQSGNTNDTFKYNVNVSTTKTETYQKVDNNQ